MTDQDEYVDDEGGSDHDGWEPDVDDEGDDE